MIYINQRKRFRKTTKCIREENMKKKILGDMHDDGNVRFIDCMWKFR